MKKRSQRLTQLFDLVRGSNFSENEIFESAVHRLVIGQDFITVDVGAEELLEEVDAIVDIMRRLDMLERLETLELAGHQWEQFCTEELSEFLHASVQAFSVVVFSDVGLREAVNFAALNPDKNVLYLNDSTYRLHEIEKVINYLQLDNLSCDETGRYFELEKADPTPSLVEICLGFGYFSKYGGVDAVKRPAEIAQDHAHPAICLLVDGELFKGGSSSNSRGILMQAGRLSGVLSLDFRQGISQSAVGTNLLILNGMGSQPEQVYISSQRLKQATPLNTKIDVVNKLFLGAPIETSDDSAEALIPAIQIVENSFIFNPERYLETETSKVMDRFVERYPVQKLEDIFEIIRPIPVKEEKDGKYQVRELMIGDLRNGETITFAQTSGRIISVSMNTFVKIRDQILKEGDILLSTKATIGKCSLLRNQREEGVLSVFGIDAFHMRVQTAVDRVGSEGASITANQGMFILRNKLASVISTEALFSFLSSQTVTDYLSGLATGTTLKHLPIKVLRQLKLPVPDKIVADDVKASLEKREMIRNTITLLTQELAENEAATWPNFELQSMLGEE